MSALYERLEAIGAGAIVLLGIVLVVVPEPATTLIGALMVVIGIGLWATKWRKRTSRKSVTTEEREESIV